VLDVADPRRVDLELFHVVNHHVGSCALAQRATVLEACSVGSQRREPVMRFLQCHGALVAHQPRQEIGGVGAAAEELGVRAAIGDTGNGVRRLHHLAHELGVRTLVGAQELHIQIALQGQIQHDLDGVLVLFFSEIADRAADVLLHIGLAVDALDDQALGVAAHTCLDDLQPAVGFLGLVHERLSQLRIGHLLDLLVLGARGDRTPGGGGVVEIPVLEREGEAGAPGAALCIDRQVLVPALVDPAQRPSMHLRILAGGRDHVVQDRPPRCGREHLEELDVGTDVAGALCDLDEALVTFRQHARQVQDVLVAHDVGDHGGAVKVGLHAVWAEALDGEAAEPGVHALVQEPGHLLALVLRCRFARFGLLEAHDVSHQRRRGHVLDDIDALGGAVERVQVLGNRLPIPVHAQPHRLVGDRFGAGHREHRAVAKLGPDRCKAETAVPEHHRGHAVVTRDGAPRVPANLGVVVGVQVDKARCHDLAGGVDLLFGRSLRAAAELSHLAVADPDVALVARHPCAVDDRPALDVNVELSAHGMPPYRSA